MSSGYIESSEILLSLSHMIYPLCIGSFNFIMIIGLWLWFKHPVYLFRLYKWYIFQRYGMRRSYINLGSVIMHAAEIGLPRRDRSSMLLIHGAGGHLLNWTPTIQYLDREKEHIISIDLPGHGLSSIPVTDDVTVDECITYIKESINKLGLENQPLHVIGQSLGGYVAAEFAVKYPKNVKLLTVVAPAGLGEVTNEFYDKVIKHDFSWIMPKTVEEVQYSMRRSMVNPPKIPNQLLSGILEEMVGKYRFLDKMLKMWMDINISGIFKLSTQIHQPTQVIWGTNDQLLPVENAELLSKHLPNCSDKFIINECGHSIPIEKPEVLASAIIDFRYKNGIY